MHSLQVSNSVVKSAGELYKPLSDEEIQEGRKIMDETTTVSTIRCSLLYIHTYVCSQILLQCY